MIGRIRFTSCVLNLRSARRAQPAKNVAREVEACAEPIQQQHQQGEYEELPARLRRQHAVVQQQHVGRAGQRQDVDHGCAEGGGQQRLATAHQLQRDGREIPLRLRGLAFPHAVPRARGRDA